MELEIRAGARIYVLDEGMRPVGEGMVGEVYVGGEWVGRGYEGEREKTAERFVPDGWSGKEGGRLYRTGELWRRGREGRVEFRGRRDRRVEVEGRRVEAGEIEARVKEYVEQRSAVEEQVAGIWKQVLGIEKIGVKDNFFAIGGHSLLATQVVARMSHAFGVEIALRRLFESPTVEELGVIIEQEKKAQGEVVKEEELALAPVAR